MTTFLRTMTARLGAALAMVIVMLAAFLGASITNLGAEAADLTDEVRAATHKANADATRFRTIEADPSAIRSTAKTLVRTMVAFLGTLATRLYARLMMLVRHETPPSSNRTPVIPLVTGARMMP
jgi:CBS domain containing-hemolysin-like protein